MLINSTIHLLGTGSASYANDCVQVDFKNFTEEKFKQWKKDKRFPTLEGCKYNAASISNEIYENKVFLTAIADIEPGEEIYVSYG